MKNQHLNCLVELVGNRVLDQAFIEAQQLLIQNLKATYLDQLAHDFQVELDRYQKQ